jgi:hypothetical protein
MTNDIPPPYELLPPVVFEAVATQPRPHDSKAAVPALPDGLPLASLRDSVQDDRLWAGITTADNRGRLSVLGAIRYLNWPLPTGVRVTLSPQAGRLTIARHGTQAVSARGHLHLKSAMRKALFLGPGDQLILVALTDPGVIIGLTAHAVGRLVTRADPGPLHDRDTA